MRNKNLILLALSLTLALYIISAVSAEIIISQPNALYSLGDEISLEIKVDSIKSGYLNVNLICSENGEQNIYRNVPESKAIGVKRKLTPDYIGNLSGTCSIIASYSLEVKASQNFEISKSLDITASLDKTSVDAGSNIRIKGTAYRKNNQLAGQVYSTFAEIKLGDNSLIAASDTVKDGQFSFSLAIPSNTRAGNYKANIRVYEKDENGNELGSGQLSSEISVIQKPAKVEIALDKLSINPGENITIVPFLYDMAGDKMNEKISVKITGSDSKVLQEIQTGSNENFIVSISKQTVPGTVIILVQKGNISAEKSFQVMELRQVKAVVENDTLLIMNTGNVPYKETAKVNIGGQHVDINIDLEVGESARYELSAPEGLYDISLKTNDSEIKSGSVMLTGNAVSVTQIREKMDNIFTNYPVVWIFLFVVLFFYAWTSYKKYERTKKFYLSPFESEKEKKIMDIKKKGGLEIINPEKVIDRIVGGEDIRKAEQVLVMNGSKQPASIIALKLKGNVSGISNESVSKALQYAYRQKAVSYTAGNSILLIFSPLMTRTFKNEETAIKAATEIDNFLKEHNRKFRNDVINYGIGVNSGEIINKLEGKILQFTSIDKTINLAKRIADISNQEVLLSKEIHEKTMNSVKAEKFASGGMDIFTIKRVINTGESAKFINEFMRRNQFGEGNK